MEILEKQGKVGKTCFGCNTLYRENSKAQSVWDFSLNMIVPLLLRSDSTVTLNILEDLGKINMVPIYSLLWVLELC